MRRRGTKIKEASIALKLRVCNGEYLRFKISDFFAPFIVIVVEKVLTLSTSLS